MSKTKQLVECPTNLRRWRRFSQGLVDSYTLGPYYDTETQILTDRDGRQYFGGPIEAIRQARSYIQPGDRVFVWGHFPIPEDLSCEQLAFIGRQGVGRRLSAPEAPVVNRYWREWLDAGHQRWNWNDSLLYGHSATVTRVNQCTYEGEVYGGHQFVRIDSHQGTYKSACLALDLATHDCRVRRGLTLNPGTGSLIAVG